MIPVRRRLVCAAILFVSCWLDGVGGQSPITFERVSLTSSGAERSGASESGSIGGDGRYVLFRSPEPGVWAPVWHVRDRQLGTTTTFQPGAPAYSMLDGVLSADGNYVAGVDFIAESRVHLWDRASGTAIWSSDYTIDPFSSVALSHSGSHVAFGANYLGLVDNFDHGGFGIEGVFVHDRNLNTTTIVSLALDGTRGDGYSSLPALSGDGRWVAFVSSSTNLVAGDVNGAEDYFLRDLQTGTVTRLATAAPAGRPALSGDGRFIALATGDAWSAGDTNGLADIYVYDQDTGTYEWISATIPPPDGGLGVGHPSISDDGRVVAFVWSSASLGTRLYRHDRQTGLTIDVAAADRKPVSLGAHGCELTFDSWDDQLVPGDTNGQADVFVATVAPCGPPAPTLSIAGGSVLEGNGAATVLPFTVSLSSPAPAAVTVDYATSDETATANADYLPVSGTLTFAIGETVKSLDLAVLGDPFEEANESVRLSLSNASGAGIGGGSALGTIIDDDDETPPILSLPANINIEILTPGGRIVDYTVSATDNRDPVPAVSCFPQAGTVFPMGTTIVECSATDAAGNTAHGSFAVTIGLMDVEPPVLLLPADIDVVATSEAGRIVAFSVTATDNRDPSPVVTCDPPSGHLFPVGPTWVECRARDASGLSSLGRFMVTVRPIMVELTITIRLSQVLPAGQTIRVVNDMDSQECLAVVNQQTCTWQFALGTPVRLHTAKSNFGPPHLSGWIGCDAMNGNGCALRVTGNRTVDVRFSRTRPQFDWTLWGGRSTWDGVQWLGFAVDFGRTADGRLLSGSAVVGYFSALDPTNPYYYICGDFVSLERFGNQVIFRTTNGYKTYPGTPGSSGPYSCLGEIDVSSNGGAGQFRIQVIRWDGFVEFSWSASGSFFLEGR